MSGNDIGELANKIYHLVKDLDSEEREKVVGAAMMLCGESLPARHALTSPRPPVIEHQRDSRRAPVSREPNFSARTDMSPKQFCHEKDPRTDIERIVCLAYYLAHYRNQSDFKTLDLSKLNTEAAQLKFSNPTVAIHNAIKRGLITSAGKGAKQISAVGEIFVDALPDREKAKKALERLRARRVTSLRRKAKKRKKKAATGAT